MHKYVLDLNETAKEKYSVDKGNCNGILKMDKGNCNSWIRVIAC